MESQKSKALNPTDLIDWLNGEGILDLDWDFPEDGDLIEAGLDKVAVAHLVTAVEDLYGIELLSADLVPANLATPLSLAALIGGKLP